MRWKLAVFVLLAATAGRSLAHGPQIQTTLEGGKIVTRELILDGPYSNSLRTPKSVYVMPLGTTAGVWYSRPNGSVLPGGLPEFNSGPGLAYGYGYDATTNPQPFPVGSQFVLSFTAGLKVWNGSAFVDAGATELEAFRGSGSSLVTARTSDVAPFANIQFPTTVSPGTGISFAADLAETHTSVSFRMLGDGASTTSALANGTYLVSLQLSSTSGSVQASDPFYFVLSKNGGQQAAESAGAALGFAPAQVQSLLVPEPASWALAAVSGLGGLALITKFRRRTTVQ